MEITDSNPKQISKFPFLIITAQPRKIMRGMTRSVRSTHPTASAFPAPGHPYRTQCFEISLRHSLPSKPKARDSDPLGAVPRTSWMPGN